ncbi:MAG: hypothetical protein O2820_21470 [Planctomycetota bacterium]|nr:hypothetical protein [Planctomycetota bacterium]MDA1251787.1 hypothetical protein [Planctomycetota bacterium]
MTLPPRRKHIRHDQGEGHLHELTFSCFRFWQEGPGFDRNLFGPEAITASMDYIHLNPVKRGLCEKATDWKWSSARFYLGETTLPGRDNSTWERQRTRIYQPSLGRMPHGSTHPESRRNMVDGTGKASGTLELTLSVPPARVPLNCPRRTIFAAIIALLQVGREFEYLSLDIDAPFRERKHVRLDDCCCRDHAVFSNGPSCRTCLTRNGRNW